MEMLRSQFHMEIERPWKRLSDLLFKPYALSGGRTSEIVREIGNLANALNNFNEHAPSLSKKPNDSIRQLANSVKHSTPKILIELASMWLCNDLGQFKFLRTAVALYGVNCRPDYLEPEQDFMQLCLNEIKEWLQLLEPSATEAMDTDLAKVYLIRSKNLPWSDKITLYADNEIQDPNMLRATCLCFVHEDSQGQLRLYDPQNVTLEVLSI